MAMLAVVVAVVVTAAEQEGGVCAWDLRESASLHASALSAALGVPSGIRPPSYSTDALSAGTDHHCCRVVCCGSLLCDARSHCVLASNPRGACSSVCAVAGSGMLCVW